MNGMALCAGAGGLELGLHLALGDAYRTVVGVEWEASAAAVLVARQQDSSFPPFPVWDSVATFDGRPWRGVVDIVSGGFPCQPFSVAGKRGGDSDSRHLWPHIARIVEESQPGIVFLENVPGLLNTPLAGGSGFAYELVESDLLRLGYRVACGLFTAAEVGAPHQRERLFILAHREGGCGFAPWPDHGLGAPEQGSPARRAVGESGGLGQFPPGPGDTGAWQRILREHPDLAPALSINEEWELGIRFPFASKAPEPPVRGVVDGLAPGMDLPRAARLRITGNGVVPQCASLAFRTLWGQLEGAMNDWPTPRTTDQDGTYSHANAMSTRRLDLRIASQRWEADNWPTPDTQNARGGQMRTEAKGKHAMSLHHVVAEWEGYR